MARIFEADDKSGFTIRQDGKDLSVIEIQPGELKEHTWKRAVEKLREIQAKEIARQEEEVL